MPPATPTQEVPDWIAGVAGLCLLGLLLLAVGQPILSDDLWIHLALGRAYASEGLWLVGDPLLANALSPPLPAAWLSDLCFHLIREVSGFQGLRIAHVLLVGGMIALVLSILRGASRSWWVASLGTSAFMILAAYRLVQLRPHLFSMLALLLLYRLLFEHRRAPSPGQVLGSVVICLLWANLHAAFVLGPAFIAAGIGGLLLAALMNSGTQSERIWKRLRPIALAGLLCTLATFLNPSGFEPHLAYWTAGDESPTLTRVADEWVSIDLLSWPSRRLPPSPLSWLLLWSLWILTPLLILRALYRGWSGEEYDQDEEGLDPALAAMAGAALCAPLFAVRFLWLGILPLILSAQAARGRANALAGGRGRLSTALPWVAAVGTWGLLAGFVQMGPWPMISAIMPRHAAGYRAPYPAAKYNAHAVWMLDDAELKGSLFGKYSAGGFLGFWLAPEIRTFVNGSLNVAPDTMSANLPILERRGERPGESFGELLDRQGIDLFLGIRLPMEGSGDRPWHYTAAHLEGESGWLPIFRNLAGAVYLRNNARNQENLQRVIRYYRRQGVPFDSDRGFEIERIITTRLDWAIQHGLVPIFFSDLLSRAASLDLPRENEAVQHLASLFATLGLYEKAGQLDRALLEEDPGDAAARRRLAWSLLRSGNPEEAAAVAANLEDSADSLSRNILIAARAAAAGDLAPGQIQRLPLFSASEARRLSTAIIRPSVRESTED
jgi:hypothetical protein